MRITPACEPAPSVAEQTSDEQPDPIRRSGGAAARCQDGVRNATPRRQPALRRLEERGRRSVPQEAVACATAALRGGGSGMSRMARTMLIRLMRQDENVTVRKVSTTPSEYEITRLRSVTCGEMSRLVRREQRRHDAG